MPKVIPEYREEAQKKIIAAGLEVMSRKGYCATSLDDIARHVGVSKTTLYLYFTNKDDLVMAVIRSVHEEIQSRAMVFFSTEPVLDAYVHLFDLLIGRDLERIGFTYDILSLSARNPEIRRIHQEHMSRVIEQATRGMEYMQQRGTARQDIDPKSMAFAMIALMSGLISLVLKGIDTDEIRTRFREMGTIILGIPGTSDPVHE